MSSINQAFWHKSQRALIGTMPMSRFTLAIDGLGELKPKASGLLCTAIVGGAIIPPMFGFLTDHIGFKSSLIFVMLCYGYILYFGFRNSKKQVVL